MCMDVKRVQNVHPKKIILTDRKFCLVSLEKSRAAYLSEKNGSSYPRKCQKMANVRMRSDDVRTCEPVGYYPDDHKYLSIDNLSLPAEPSLSHFLGWGQINGHKYRHIYI